MAAYGIGVGKHTRDDKVNVLSEVRLLYKKKEFVINTMCTWPGVKK